MMGSTNGLENIMLSDTVVRYNQVMVCVIAQQILSTHIETEFTEHTIELRFPWKKNNIGTRQMLLLCYHFRTQKIMFFFSFNKCTISTPYFSLHTAICSTFVVDIDTVYSFENPPFLYTPSSAALSILSIRILLPQLRKTLSKMLNP